MFETWKRKRSIAAILKEYEKEYKRELPTSFQEDFKALQKLNLLELAIAFDTLEGWNLVDKIPQLSNYRPSLEDVPPPSSGLQESIRRMKYLKKIRDFKGGDVFNPCKRIVEDNGELWK